MGKFLVILILGSAALMGGGMYYLQVFAYYVPVTISDGAQTLGTTQIKLTPLASGQAEVIKVSNFEGIDANSSPLRFRGCFTLGESPESPESPESLESLGETYVGYPDAEPLKTPGWFDCFDPGQIDQDIESGAAIALLSEENFKYGIDRIIVVYPDGRAYSWHQINACGDLVFNGDPVPDDCPPLPEASN